MWLAKLWKAIMQLWQRKKTKGRPLLDIAKKKNAISKCEIFMPSAKKHVTCAMSLGDAPCFTYGLLWNMAWSLLWCKTWQFSVHMGKASKIKLVGYQNNTPETLMLNLN